MNIEAQIIFGLAMIILLIVSGHYICKGTGDNHWDI